MRIDVKSYTKWSLTPPQQMDKLARGFIYSIPVLSGTILKTITGGVVSIDENFPISSIISESFELLHNYPNPFNPSTTIEFDLPKTSEVILKIFNILGEEVATLVSDRLSAGSYTYEWDASNLASGVYLYRLQSGKYVETKKMVLMK